MKIRRYRRPLTAVGLAVRPRRASDYGVDGLLIKNERAGDCGLFGLLGFIKRGWGRAVIVSERGAKAPAER